MRDLHQKRRPNAIVDVNYYLLCLSTTELLFARQKKGASLTDHMKIEILSKGTRANIVQCS